MWPGASPPRPGTRRSSPGTTEPRRILAPRARLPSPRRSTPDRPVASVRPCRELEPSLGSGPAAGSVGRSGRLPSLAGTRTSRAVERLSGLADWPAAPRSSRGLVEQAPRNGASASTPSSVGRIPLSLSRTLSAVKGRTPSGLASSSSPSASSRPSGRKARSRIGGGTRLPPAVRTRAITSRDRFPARPSDRSGTGSRSSAPSARTAGSSRLSGLPLSCDRRRSQRGRSCTRRAVRSSSSWRNPLAISSGSPHLGHPVGGVPRTAARGPVPRLGAWRRSTQALGYSVGG